MIYLIIVDLLIENITMTFNYNYFLSAIIWIDPNWFASFFINFIDDDLILQEYSVRGILVSSYRNSLQPNFLFSFPLYMTICIHCINKTSNEHDYWSTLIWLITNLSDLLETLIKN